MRARYEKYDGEVIQVLLSSCGPVRRQLVGAVAAIPVMTCSEEGDVSADEAEEVDGK